MMRAVAGLALLFGMQSVLADGDRETIDIRVAHLSRDRWQARYRLAVPASRLRFIQVYGARRHGRWKVDTPGVRLVADAEGREYLESTSGRAFRDAKLHFVSDITKLDREYPLNRRFTDRSQWLCLLHLYAAPMRDGKEAPSRFRVDLAPLPNEGLVLGGQGYAQRTTWIDPHDDRGTFAYFGKLQPVESPDVIAVVDPGLPGYLKKIFEQQLPELFAYYSRKLDIALPRRPSILISYHPDDDLNQGDSGDVLPDVIAFDFRSRRMWETPNAGNARTSFHLLAHEAAHLWNGSRFESAQNSDAPWMHEGGADAFDWGASRDLGALDDRSLRTEIELKLNACLYGLAPLGVSLREALKRHVFELAYSCGSVMNFAVDAALRDRGGQFAFWRALLAKAATSADQYSVVQYFATLRELDPDGALAEVMSDLWSQPQGDLVATLRRMLASAGVVVAAGNVQPDFERLYARRAISELLSQDCGGAFSFSTHDEVVDLIGLKECRVLKNRKVTVAAMAGEPVKNPMPLYAAIAKRCAERNEVIAQIADSDETLALPCARPLPDVTPYLTISSWPRGK